MITPASRGFTLVETLVAITVLVISIVGPLYVVFKSLSASYTARDTLIATALAQEGMEVIRYWRDTNYLSGNGNWLNAISPTCVVTGSPGPNDYGCNVDFPGMSIAACPASGCVPLRLDTQYRYRMSSNAAWAVTRFTRTVTATQISSNEVKVEVRVTWSTFRVPYTVTVTENLRDWQ